jgi:chaperonin GroES
MSSVLSRIMPLLDRVLVRRVAAETKTKGGLLLPQAAVTKLNQAVVVAVGPGARNQNTGEVIPPPVAVGDRVLLPEWGGNSVKLNDSDGAADEYHLFRGDDLLAVLPKEDSN